MPTTLFALVLLGFGAWLLLCVLSAMFLRSEMKVAPELEEEDINYTEVRARGHVHIVVWRDSQLREAWQAIEKSIDRVEEEICSGK